MNSVGFLEVEIEPVVAAAQTVEFMTGAGKAAQRFPRMLKIGGFKRADGFDSFELLEFIELIQLQHALFGKGDLIHGGSA